MKIQQTGMSMPVTTLPFGCSPVTASADKSHHREKAKIKISEKRTLTEIVQVFFHSCCYQPGSALEDRAKSEELLRGLGLPNVCILGGGGCVREQLEAIRSKV